MENIEDYDLLLITKLDRFARSTRDLLNRLDDLEENGTDLRATDQPIKTDDDMYGDIMLKLLGVFAEWERKMIRQRLEEGYEKAKEEGRVGRPEALSDDEKEELAAMYESKRFSWKGLQEKFDVSRSTISKALKEKDVLEGEA